MSEEFVNDEILYFSNYDYATALIGISHDERAVYDYDLMIEFLVKTEGFTYEEAVDFANEYLPDYAESMSHAAFGWDGEYTEEEYEEYIENCGFDIEESEEDE